MNTPNNRPAVGSQVRFFINFRTWIGHVNEYSASGYAMITTEEGKKFTLPSDMLTVLESPSRRFPAAEGLAASRGDAQATNQQFKIGDPVDVAAVGVLAKVVGVSDDGLTLEVVYEDMVEVFEVDACNATLLTDKPASVVRRVAKLEAEITDLKRQLAEVIHERNVTRYALRQIVAYNGSRYTDDAEVMKEIAEAALDGENITPRR